MSNKVKRRKPNTKNGSSLKVPIITVLVLLLCLGLVGVLSVLLYEPPLVIDENPFGTDAPDTAPDAETTGGEGEDAPVVNGNESGVYDKRIEGKYNFLLIGRDKVALNTDVIMIVSYDVPSGSLSIMQIPRDTYMDGRRINSHYANHYTAAVKAGAKDPYLTALTEFGKSIQQNFNIVIDRVVLVNLAGFRNIVDIIGGVPIDVPFDMKYDDPDQDLYIDIKKGYQTLDGKEAEGFVRFRHDYLEGDIGRVDAQKLFISAFLAEVKRSISVSTVAGIVDEAIKNVTTSLSVSDCVYFAKNALSLDLENIKMMTLPGCEARANVDSGAWYYVMQRADTLNLVNKYFNVFTDDITDDIFDRKNVFVDESREHFVGIYTKPATDSKEYNADDIVSGKIPNIPIS